MSMADRAAQFSAFAALTGHGAAIAEAARLTDERPILDESVKLEISDRLQAAAAAPSIALKFDAIGHQPMTKATGAPVIEYRHIRPLQGRYMPGGGRTHPRAAAHIQLIPGNRGETAESPAAQHHRDQQEQHLAHRGMPPVQATPQTPQPDEKQKKSEEQGGAHTQHSGPPPPDILMQHHAGDDSCPEQAEGGIQSRHRVALHDYNSMPSGKASCRIIPHILSM